MYVPFTIVVKSSSFCNKSQPLLRAELSVAETKVKIRTRVVREIQEARRLRNNTIADGGNGYFGLD